jgi:long-chain fatty acid transport protein
MKVKQLILAAAMGSVSSGVLASGFAISGKSASNLGNAFSGTTVLAEDASVVYTNPAAMQDMEGRHFSALLHVIGSNLHFEDKGSSTSGPSSSSVTDPHYVPNLYYVTPLADDLRFGLGIYSPFGLGLDYADNWKGRYITTGSDMKIVNISPMISFKASDKVNIGLGIDAQYLNATLKNAVDFGTICYGKLSSAICSGAGLTPQGNDGSQTLTGTDWAYGYSLGLTYDINESTRVGMSYHSAVLHNINGHSDFSDVPTLLQSVFADTGASLSMTLPETLSLGISHKYSSRLQVMADVTRTGWSSYDKLVIKFDNSIPTSSTTEDWNDSWRYSIGGNYRISDRWLMRAGISHDETPIPDAQHRSPRVPGATRDWVSLGSNIVMSKGVSMDLAASYTIPVTYKIDNTDSLNHKLKGEYKSDILYLTAQVNWQF